MLNSVLLNKPGTLTPYRYIATCLLVCAAILLPRSYAAAQSVFNGILINSNDSSVIPYAAISIKETGEGLLTNELGAFTCSVPKRISHITIQVSSLCCKAIRTFSAPFSDTERIYLSANANALEEVAVKGLSAEEVVKMAVAAIPLNYTDSSYFDYSFYRRYQKVNGAFTNLAEARPVVMFRLIKEKNSIRSNEAFSVTQMRRSKYHPNIMNVQEDNPADLLIDNPVFHLKGSSLDPSRFPGYQFNFDTTIKGKDYRIRYISTSYSTDKHGIGDFADRDLNGETWETGELVIDRESFAIKSISRKSYRHKNYHYKFFPPQNNIVPLNPDHYYNGHKYFFEFLDGDLQAEYKEHSNGKWYLDKICRSYSHDFYLAVFDTKEFVITDNFEWYSDATSRYVSADYVDGFYSKMMTSIYGYDSAFWAQQAFPFHYADKETVYRHLQRDGVMDKQFIKESTVDEYAKKPAKK